MTTTKAAKGTGDTVTLTARVDRETWLAFREATARRGESMNDAFKRLIAEYVEGSKKA